MRPEAPDQRPLVDLEALAGWMDAQGLPSGRIGDVEPLRGGTQNILVRFERGGERYVLRRPPRHKRANSDETMRREARVLAALAGTDVPHARLIASCSDASVLGFAFYLMEPVAGLNPTVELPPRYVDAPAWRREFGLDVADGAARVGSVDHVALGLDDLGKADGFLERQVARWRAQLDSYGRLRGYPGPDIPAVARVARWLEGNMPTDWRPGLIHGDYHLANVMCAVDRPRVAAIVDWELSTVGDPLLDLGWLLATWPDDDHAIGTIRVQPFDGFPSRGELVARYAERSGRDLSAIAWYEVLACYKLGIIVEGTYARACAGLAPQETGAILHATARTLFRRAVGRIAGA